MTPANVDDERDVSTDAAALDEFRYHDEAQHGSFAFTAANHHDLDEPCIDFVIHQLLHTPNWVVT